MSYAQPKQYFASTQRAIANADAIEWEEMPSMARRVVQRGANDSQFMGTSSFGTVWDNTLPAAFDEAPISPPFREPMVGLSTREVNEPDVFAHFFGPNASY